MINVYTNTSCRKKFKNVDIIINVNARFQKEITNILKNFNDLDSQFIREIDSGTVHIVENNLVIITPDGVIGLNDLSTGCKTCILANHLHKKMINLTLSGENAIISLFGHLPNNDNSFLLTHTDFKPLEQGNFKINDNKTGSLFDVWDTIAMGKKI